MPDFSKILPTDYRKKFFVTAAKHRTHHAGTDGSLDVQIDQGSSTAGVDEKVTTQVHAHAVSQMKAEHEPASRELPEHRVDPTTESDVGLEADGSKGRTCWQKGAKLLTSTRLSHLGSVVPEADVDGIAGSRAKAYTHRGSVSKNAPPRATPHATPCATTRATPRKMKFQRGSSAGSSEPTLGAVHASPKMPANSAGAAQLSPRVAALEEESLVRREPLVTQELAEDSSCVSRMPAGSNALSASSPTAVREEAELRMPQSTATRDSPVQITPRAAEEAAAETNDTLGVWADPPLLQKALEQVRRWFHGLSQRFFTTQPEPSEASSEQGPSAQSVAYLDA